MSGKKGMKWKEKQEPKKNITIQLEQEYYDKITLIAEHNDWARSKVVQKIIKGEIKP